MTETYTIIAKPDQWRFVNAYDPAPFGERERFGVVLKDVSLLPEEVANEAPVSRDGSVYMASLKRPAVEHIAGWEELESEIRRMEATNRPRDGLFKDAILEIDFQMFSLPPRPGSRYTTPLVILAVSRIMILGPAAS